MIGSNRVPRKKKTRAQDHTWNVRWPKNKINLPYGKCRTRLLRWSSEVNSVVGYQFFGRAPQVSPPSLLIKVETAKTKRQC
jgi:hypothetical protein